MPSSTFEPSPRRPIYIPVRRRICSRLLRVLIVLSSYSLFFLELFCVACVVFAMILQPRSVAHLQKVVSCLQPSQQLILLIDNRNIWSKFIVSPGMAKAGHEPCVIAISPSVRLEIVQPEIL